MRPSQSMTLWLLVSGEPSVSDPCRPCYKPSYWFMEGALRRRDPIKPGVRYCLVGGQLNTDGSYDEVFEEHPDGPFVGVKV